MSHGVQALRCGRRESGVLLLTVALLLAIMAALAFTMNRAAGMDVQSVSGDYDRRNAGYLAEAALAAAKWTNELNKCDNKVTALTPFTLAGATLSAIITKSPPKLINVVATATFTTSTTLTRNSVQLLDLSSKEEKDLGGAVRDTFINSTLARQDGTKTLVLTSAQSNALVFWPMNDIPANSRVLSARLTLTQPAGSTVARTVSVHGLATQWDPSATWTQARPGTNWTSAGGDYLTPALASVDVSDAGAYSLDVSPVVDDWVNGRQVDNGFLLRLPNPGQTVTFTSFEGGGQKPVLHVMFVKQC